MADLVLAIVHHVLVFGLAAMLAAQTILVRQGMNGSDANRVARLDIGYGATAGLILIVGGLRVMFGLKGPDYYVMNVWFWAKLTSFLVIGLLSVPPTLRFRAWLKAGKNDPGFTPADSEIADVRSYLRLELVFLAILLACAASMARYTSF